MAQVINGIALNSTEGFDKITSTDKITTGYFTDNVGTLNAASIHSASLSSTNENYYFGIAKDNATGSVQFHVTYGNVNGYGADTDAGGVKSQTEAIYKEWANILLPENEVTGGFLISKPGSSSALSARDESIYVLVAKRGLFKDRLNKKNWVIVLSGSSTGQDFTAGALGGISASNALHLTDDSKDTAATSTPAGPRYNIVSGSLGTVHTAASTRTFGWIYPDQGVLVFSAAELSASIPGSGSQVDTRTVYGDIGDAAALGAGVNAASFRGFATTTNIDQNYHQALRFVNCLKPDGAYLQFRAEEDQTSVSYFCRARAAHFNFSNNPTFVSGSQNELRQSTMRGNPTTFITSVQLYNSAGDMVAVGNLSTPLKKNFSSEATIKVKLTY